MQKIAKRGDVEAVMFGLEHGQIIFREAKQADSRRQAPRMFGMRRCSKFFCR